MLRAVVCLQLHDFKFLNFCPHVSCVKFHADHFVSSAVHAAVGYLDSDINKCKIAVASGQRKNLVTVYAGYQTYFLGRSRPRLNMDFVY